MKKIIAIAAIMLLFWGLNKVHATPAGATATTATCTDVRDKNGKLAYQVKRYTEDQLNRPVKSLVHSQYAAYDITGVEEIVIPSTKESIYLVHLQDDTQIKIVRVYNGETQETETYKRG